MEHGSVFSVQLRMYDLNEVVAHVKTWEEAIRTRAESGLLVLSGMKHLRLQQTCGWPLISDQRTEWRPIAVPIYEARGCQRHLYTSLIIVKVVCCKCFGILNMDFVATTFEDRDKADSRYQPHKGRIIWLYVFLYIADCYK